MEKISLEYENILVDFGSQYTNLIKKLIQRDLGIMIDLIPYFQLPKTKIELNAKYPSFKRVILSGGPRSVNNPKSPKPDLSIFQDCYVFGICYGAQLIGDYYNIPIISGEKDGRTQERFICFF